MEILVTSTSDLEKGAHSRPHQFIEYLSKNHHVTVLCMNSWWLVNQYGKRLYAHIYNKNVTIKYLTSYRVGPLLQEAYSTIKTILNSLPKEFKYQDIYINFDSVVLGYFISKKMNQEHIPVVFDLDDDVPEMIRTSTNVPLLLRPLGGFVGNLMIRKIMEVSDRITITTESLKNSYNIPKNKSEIIPNGVDTNLFKNYPSDQLKQELGINGEFVIGYVGVLREWVDLKPIFSAIKDTDLKIKLLIVGEEGGFKRNKELVEKYGISDKVVFTGTVPFHKVPEYISCMDIGLIPFKINAITENALPLKLFEYMACGKPVISTRLNGVMEVVGNKVLYFSNSEELKQRILELYRNEGLRKELGQEGRTFVEQNYSWDRICRRFEEILIKVAQFREGKKKV
jgi:glycosyltransferase involved in cell wall biosynthesis